MATIPTTEPTQARAGLTWQWTRSSADYPAPSWVLTYYFKQLKAGGTHFSVAATASGADHAVTIAAATTAAYTADEYSWSAIAVKGAEAFEVDTGVLTILPRYDAGAALDDRSHARKMLDALEAVLESRAGSDVLEYEIAGRRLKKMSAEDLTKWHAYYAGKVAAEEREANGGGGAKLVARL